MFGTKFSLVAQMIKHLAAMRETQVRFLVWENPQEKEMAIHSSILTWRIPWVEESCGLQDLWGCEELVRTEQHTFSLSISS